MEMYPSPSHRYHPNDRRMKDLSLLVFLRQVSDAHRYYLKGEAHGPAPVRIA